MTLTQKEMDSIGSFLEHVLYGVVSKTVLSI